MGKGVHLAFRYYKNLIRRGRVRLWLRHREEEEKEKLKRTKRLLVRIR